MKKNLKVVLLSGIILLLAGVILAQTAANKTLVVNGTSAGAAVREIDGHTYIEIEALARVTNGVVTIEPTRVLLSIPSAASLVNAGAAVTTAAPVAARPAVGLSVEFKRAAISELSEMREWRGAIGAMITYGLAAGGATAQDYHAICESGLSQATVVATTNDDLNAVQLLKGEFDTLTAWAAQVVADRKALNGARTIDPNSMANDPVLTKITACGRFLNSMIVSGAYADDASCH
ncbi:MAG TPA: hypothetical protein VIH72_06800 [Candidatus Acidoferrales bacterium]